MNNLASNVVDINAISESEQAIIDRAIEIIESRSICDRDYCNSAEIAKRYCKLQFSNMDNEAFGVVFLDAQYGIIEYKAMFHGTIDGCSVYPRVVVQHALKVNAAACIFTHCHPSGISSPSPSDDRITRRLKDALDLVEIRVVDHIIVGNECYSYLEDNRL